MRAAACRGRPIQISHPFLSWLASRRGAGNATLPFVPVPNHDSDFFHQSYLDDAALKTAYQQVSLDARELVRGYIAGCNQFVQAAPAAGAPARNSCDGQAWVRPIEERDFLRQRLAGPGQRALHRLHAVGGGAVCTRRCHRR